MADKNPVVTIQMASGGRIVFELWPHCAPNACNSVIHLAQAGAYNGQLIDRIVPGYAIQPLYGNKENPVLNYLIDGEFAANGYPEGPPIVEGMVAMAGDSKRFASGSSFYFALTAHERFQGNFSIVGKVIEGWDEVKRIEHVKTVSVPSGKPNVEVNRPLEPEIMQTVTVDTFGVTYDAPVKLALDEAESPKKEA